MFSFNQSIFSSSSGTDIPEEVEIIFVSDAFSVDYPGGAEMTTDAIIDSSPFNVLRLHAKHVTMELLEKGMDRYWIFGNFSSMNLELIPSIVANLQYSIVEYDYKYCRYRSPEKHASAENSPCNCHNEDYGKMISAFFYGAKCLWWMSEKQRERYHTMFPFLNDRVNTVLSSVFDENFFLKIQELREKYKNSDRTKWIIVGSTSWIKGVQDAEELCKEKNLDYEVVFGVDYEEMLHKFAQSKGLVFLPKGGDTCPRTVIEAKLLGCELILNDNVQHAKELWFDADDELDTLSYLYAARNRFWNGLKYSMNFNPTLSGYTTTLNCIKQGYPFRESIKSLLGFCNEVVIVDGGSSDGTWEEIQEWAKEEDRLLIHQENRDWDHKRFAVFDGLQKAVARSLCTQEFCWQQDVDEIVHEDDYEKVKYLINNFPKDLELVALPVIEYWGGPEKVRADINPWKWRLSKNLPHITHGIPANLRKYDDAGELYSSPGSDGCDYVRSDNYQQIRFATFYSPDVDRVRSQINSDDKSLGEYQAWFNQTVSQLPGVHHYSWFDISRKIKTYKNYWSKHWQSLYDIEQQDTPDNNMFFDKSWKDVSDEEIEDLDKSLSDKFGGWIFHQKIDFSRPTRHVVLERSHPDVMSGWIKNHK